MLPRNQRLPFAKSRDVFQKGKRISSTTITIFCLKRDNPSSRWLILIPKKVAAKAVDRNRLKRIFSEAIVRLTPELKSIGDFVVRARSPLTKAKTQDAEEILREILK